MNVIRRFQRINIACIIIYLVIFAMQTYQEQSPAWRILAILAIMEAAFFFYVVPMLKKRVAEMEKEETENQDKS